MYHPTKNSEWKKKQLRDKGGGEGERERGRAGKEVKGVKVRNTLESTGAECSLIVDSESGSCTCPAHQLLQRGLQVEELAH